MIRAVEVINFRKESVRFDLADPEKSGFAITNIDGIGPVKANINTASLATMDGSRFNSARVDKRNIVFTIVFDEDFGIERARRLSYKYFPTKRYLCLRFETDEKTYEIYGYVESNDPVFFGKNCYTQVSIICPNPYFYSGSADSDVVMTLSASTFEFPFCNDSLTQSLISFETPVQGNSFDVLYDGEVETGFTIHISFEAVFRGSIIIKNNTTEETLTIKSDNLANINVLGDSFASGDELTISSKSGSKYATLKRGDVEYNVFFCLDGDYDWLHLLPGNNDIVVRADLTNGGDLSSLENIKFIFEYTRYYEGL